MKLYTFKCDCGAIHRIRMDIKTKNRAAKQKERGEKAIDLLRSAFAIAKRDGRETNWEAFRGQLDKFFQPLILAAQKAATNNSLNLDGLL